MSRSLTAVSLFLVAVAFILMTTVGNGALRAQSSSNFTVMKWSLDTGGNVSASNDYAVMDAFGLEIPPGDASSENYASHGGFLAGDGPVIGVASDDEEVPVLPSSFDLFQNYPNPFSTGTTVSFALKEAANVQLAVFDVLGHEVHRLVDGSRPAGYHTMQWDGRDRTGGRLPSGIYVCRLTVTEKSGTHRLFEEVTKMVRLR